MPKSREIALTSLDLLLLAILKQAPATNYFALQQQWGLSIGTTHPALARLRRTNLVEIKPATEGKAGSISLTRRGRQALEASWRTSLTTARNPEEIMRAVTLAALLGNARDKRQALGAAREVAARRRASATKRRVDLEGFGRRKNTPVGLHMWMTALLDTATWGAEAAVLEEIAKELEGAGQEIVDSSGSQAPQPEAAPSAVRLEDIPRRRDPLQGLFEERPKL
ncbi:MAG: hypothetical protein DMG25_16570 [Acidobacteria bacterium]|nr:MAG: hypothetical protein DMG25_16570 [Acidobacteriota bacterium]